MIRMAFEITYTGDVTLKYSARCFKVWLPLKAASVPGTMMSDWAKMIGITLAVLSRSGMNVFCPSRMRPRPITLRSEERRVGKEGRVRWSREDGGRGRYIADD